MSEQSSEPQRCFVVAVCAVCERQASRDTGHAPECSARRQKWHLRQLVPVIRTPYPAAEYVAIKRDEHVRLLAMLDAKTPTLEDRC